MPELREVLEVRSPGVRVLWALWLLWALFAGHPSATPAELLVLPERLDDPRLAALQKAIEGIHRKAVRARTPIAEEELRRQVPSRLLGLERRLASSKDPRARPALAHLALLYAELAWVERILPIQKTLVELDADLAGRLGHFEESKHFLARVVGADPKWAGAALKLGEAAFEGYLELFGFRSISKVPGKKIRILIRVEPGQKTRLYFHPTPLYHGEMRLEVPDERSLTIDGRHRIVYGFCHEFGHMVAMWGQHGVVEDDKHAWAHYTGCLVVEEVYERLGNEPWPTWTAFQRRASGKERLLAEVKGTKTGTVTRDSILALFHAVGEELGTRVYGTSWEWLERKRRFRRINNVPYLWLEDLREALVAVVPREKASRIGELFAGE